MNAEERNRAWAAAMSGVELPEFDQVLPLAWSRRERKNVVMRDGMPIGHITLEMDDNNLPVRAEFQPIEDTK